MNARQEKKYKQSPETLMKAILSMQEKLIKNEKGFLEAPLMVEVEMGDGRCVPRPNPFVQEYRAMVRDFSAALKVYKDITGDQGTVEASSLESIRNRFKVAK
jgi:hypothetical protein